jgi:hypothetical protein
MYGSCGFLSHGLLSPCETTKQETNISHVVCSSSCFVAERNRSLYLKIVLQQGSIKFLLHVTRQSYTTCRLYLNSGLQSDIGTYNVTLTFSVQVQRKRKVATI